jgi:hypothetical protein
VYCAEGVDHGGKALNLVLADGASLVPQHRPDLLGGVTVLVGKGQAALRGEDGTVKTEPADLTLIPNYAWCHRGPNQMVIWFPKTVELAEVPPPPTIASTSRISASHTWDADTNDAVSDLVLPRDSNDHSIPRFTWWDHRGTAEWIQYELKQPTRVSAVEVYWFDDTGRGSCRVPQSWKLLVRLGEEWVPVKTESEFGVARDKFNRVEFEPLTTGALRVEVQLQPNFSGGILEWAVRP